MSALKAMPLAAACVLVECILLTSVSSAQQKAGNQSSEKSLPVGDWSGKAKKEYDRGPLNEISTNVQLKSGNTTLVLGIEFREEIDRITQTYKCAYAGLKDNTNNFINIPRSQLLNIDSGAECPENLDLDFVPREKTYNLKVVFKGYKIEIPLESNKDWTVSGAVEKPRDLKLFGISFADKYSYIKNILLTEGLTIDEISQIDKRYGSQILVMSAYKTLMPDEIREYCSRRNSSGVSPEHRVIIVFPKMEIQSEAIPMAISIETTPLPGETILIPEASRQLLDKFGPPSSKKDDKDPFWYYDKFGNTLQNTDFMGGSYKGKSGWLAKSNGSLPTFVPSMNGSCSSNSARMLQIDYSTKMYSCSTSHHNGQTYVNNFGRSMNVASPVECVFKITSQLTGSTNLEKIDVSGIDRDNYIKFLNTSESNKFDSLNRDDIERASQRGKNKLKL